MNAEALIVELEYIIDYYKRPDANFIHSEYKSAEEAVQEMTSIIGRLKNNENEALDRVSFLFAPTGVIQDISIDSGWADDYLKISERVDYWVGAMRVAQKNDAGLFSDEKDGKYTDNSTYARCPGRLTISNEKWRKIKELYDLSFFKKIKVNAQRARVQEFIRFGDTQPALVVSESPLMIAAFSDEMDAVVLLRFPQEYAHLYNLKKDDRLITVNVYSHQKIFSDIFIGPKYLKRYLDFTPHIGDFLSSETEIIRKHKENIPEKIWQYVKAISANYLAKHKGLSREGFWFVR